MPTYNYKCNGCGVEFSIIQSIKDEPLEVCDDCGSIVRRLLSGNVGLIFKGSGFYLTDYVRKPNKSEKENSNNSNKNPSNNKSKQKSKNEVNKTKKNI